ncbi:MAG: TatD family hydrolase [Candidatus Omnitrophica bacterium]|nr:TatD family hydrolase [Candidatus Omnitrophota bacterium]
MLQDTHIHIQDIKSSEGMTQFITACEAAGFGRFFDCAITPADWPTIRSLAENDPLIVPFFGFHPWFADLADDKSLKNLEEYLAWPRALAGEMGLDRARKNIDFELQKDVFAQQLVLAEKFKKPFAVHCVRAWGETIKLIRAHAPGLRFLMHSFNGAKEIAQEISQMGGYFSISVRQFLKPDDQAQIVFQSLPEDRILIETDFPYQVKWTNPQDYAQAVCQGYETAAAWKDLPTDQFIQKIFANGTAFTA